MDLPISLAVIEAVQSTSESPIVRLPTSGGSLPLSIISENLRTVTITVPIANYDNNQHAENENIRLQNLWDGIETFAALMTMKPSRYAYLRSGLPFRDKRLRPGVVFLTQSHRQPAEENHSRIVGSEIE